MKKILLFVLMGILLIGAPAFGADNKIQTIKLDNPLEFQKGQNIDDPATIIGYIIQAFLSIVGGVALVMMVYGGFQWLTAAGNEEKIKSGTQTMLWSAIGLILVFSSYLLASTVFNFIGFH